LPIATVNAAELLKSAHDGPVITHLDNAPQKRRTCFNDSPAPRKNESLNPHITARAIAMPQSLLSGAADRVA
jgi:hypothetical protein